jgi:hypothetical protein
MLIKPTKKLWLLNTAPFYAAAVVAATTTLDPATLDGAAVALSNGNLTVTNNTGTNNLARSVSSHASGKFYCEFTIGRASNTTIGVCNATAANTEYMGQTFNSGGFVQSGGWVGNNFTGTITAPSLIAGHTYGLAVDVTDGTGWVIDITGGTGQWNANATANPAANTNGCGFTSPNLTANPLNACISCNDGGGDNTTFNFGATAYAGTPPSGFVNW